MGKVPPEEHREAVYRHRRPQQGSDPGPPGGGRGQSQPPPSPGQHPAPVEPQVEAHQQEPPVGGRHVDQPGGSRPAGQPQEGKDVVGQQHPADQQPRHVQQEQAVDQGSEPPQDGPRPPG